MKMLDELQKSLEICEEVGNLTLYNSFLKSYPKIYKSKSIVVPISGGSDSDIVVDIWSTLDLMKKSRFVFFDTGIEYEATKIHLDFLEDKYGIKIDRVRAITPVPLGCKKYGQPFWSKYASDMIERLQKHNFKWEDKPFNELIQQYPKCRGALRWWCNDFEEKHDKNGKLIKSKFNINYIFGLKEYMIAFPPDFKISSKCCKGAKKDNAKKYLEENNADLCVLGIRKSEGGIRSTSYKSCFSEAKDDETWDNYRPIFWYSNLDKEIYEQIFGVTHSLCYRKYGLTRTWCAGCPFGKDFEKELEIIEKYEPKLYKAVNAIFGESYNYTRKFYIFRDKLKNENLNSPQQLSIFDTI